MRECVIGIFLLQVVFVLGVNISCQSDPNQGKSAQSSRLVDTISPETVAHSQAYKQSGNYIDLKWLADNFLEQEFSRSAVETVLGVGSSPYVGSEKSCQMYPSTRDEPWGHLLLIHYQNQIVESWEWASE